MRAEHAHDVAGGGVGVDDVGAVDPRMPVPHTRLAAGDRPDRMDLHLVI